ncbi:hypothetical protein E1A91_D06G000200v1 [Gossypium mustelinum]|uniref:AMP-dependent synthetase/ligase domain-containing protein n=2 Tax=Gossypium TaxID=3633 RepID=A0A5D2UCP6_GOSMU|nr:hypothetical protein E1A91_D06G000200v1 [Gossypium mustelinum]
MFDYLWSKSIATVLQPLHVLPTKSVYKKIRSAIGIQKTAKSGGGSLPKHIEKFYETIGLEVQNGYGLIETSPCVAGRQPYYNVYNSLFRSVFEIYRYGSVCFFLVAFSETDFSGIQKRISSSPNAIKLIVFSFIRISLAYTELKRIYEGFLFSYSKSHCYVPLKLWISVWASVLAFGPVPSLVYGLLGFYPAWRLSDPICKCTKTKVSLLWTSAIHINPRHLSTI